MYIQIIDTIHGSIRRRRLTYLDVARMKHTIRKSNHFVIRIHNGDCYGMR